MNFRKSRAVPEVGFQIAPMIDIVFLLLCFFVTTQIFSQWELEIDITLPTADSGTVPQRLPGEVVVNLYPDGSTVVNGRELDERALAQMLERLATVFHGQQVILRADKRTAYEHVVRVIDLCREADIWNISFATGAPEA